MAEYYQLFSQYINIPAIVQDGLKFGLLSCVIALVVLILVHKLVLVRRRYAALKYIARSYYFFIPVICLLFGASYGVITSTRDQVIEKLPLYQTSLQTLVQKNININVKVAIYSNKNLDEAINDAVGNIQEQLMAKLTPSGQNQPPIPPFILTVLASPIAIKYIKAQLQEQLSTKSNISKLLVNNALDFSLSKLLTGEMIVKIIIFYVVLITNSILLPVTIIWIILLLLPLVEIIFAYFYNRRFEAFIKSLK